MRRTTIILAAAGVALAAGTAGACDDHHGECTIEDWRWKSVPIMESVHLDGVATCDAGQLALRRLYEGEGGRFLGAKTGYIRQHVFQVAIWGVNNPADVAIKYGIKPQ